MQQRKHGVFAARARVVTACSRLLHTKDGVEGAGTAGAPATAADGDLSRRAATPRSFAGGGSLLRCPASGVRAGRHVVALLGTGEQGRPGGQRPSARSGDARGGRRQLPLCRGSYGAVGDA
jgi:hypothetical protein